jgi:hypothetical protein
MKKIVCLLLALTGVTFGAAFKNEMHTEEYLYDFTVSGGSSASAIDLSAVSGYSPLPDGAIVTGVTMKVLTALTASANTSVSVGNSASASGYIPAVLYSNIGSSAVSNAYMQAGSLVWDDSNDCPKPYVANASNKRDFKITFNNDVTAGKILFWVQYYMPSL